MKVKIKRSLVDDHGREFNIGSDVAFDYKGAAYIAEIYEIGEKNFIIGNIECGKQHVDGIQMIPIEAVKEFRYVYYD
jgi:hypothetical protein